MKFKKIVFLSALIIAFFASSMSLQAAGIRDCNCNVTVKDTIPATEESEEDSYEVVEKKYGDTPEDSVSCLTNSSLYREYYKQWEASKFKNDQLLKDALPGWRKVFDLCPKSSKNIYIKGARMYKRLIDIEKDSVRRAELIDTLMLIYDRRVIYYGKNTKYDKNYFTGQKAYDMYDYYKKDPLKHYPLFKEAFEASGPKTAPNVMSGYYSSTYVYVAMKYADMPLLFYTYLDLKKALEIAMQDTTSKDFDRYDKVDKSLDVKMATVATCDRIERYLGDAYTEDSTNLDLCNLIVFMSDIRKCNDSPLYFRAAAQAYRLDPSAESAFSMGRLSLQKEKFEEAEKYLTDATEQMSDSLASRKADAYLMLAETYLKQGKISNARNAARSVLDYRANDNRAYMIMGDAYAQADCKVQGLNVAYWAAYDKYTKALSITSDDDEKVKEALQKKIAAVKSRFPLAADIFQRNLTEGQSIRVECWVGETTTIRARK